MSITGALDWARLVDARSHRASSFDRRGGNKDRISIASGETITLLDASGPGCVTHIWMTGGTLEPDFLRKLVLRMYWDGEAEPSVLVPLGDFFGMGHGETANFWSLPLVMAPSGGLGLNCYFPMPFSNGARIEVTSENFVTETPSTTTSTMRGGRSHRKGWAASMPSGGVRTPVMESPMRA